MSNATSYCVSLCCAILLSCPALAKDGSFSHLTIISKTGKKICVGVSEDGTFKSPSLPVGTYHWQWSLGCQTTATSGWTSKIEAVVVKHECILPDDAKSKLPSWMRINNPTWTTRTLDTTTRYFATDLGALVISRRCSGIKGYVQFKMSHGAMLAPSDYLGPYAKTSRNTTSASDRNR